MNKFKNSAVRFEWAGGLMRWMQKDFHLKTNPYYLDANIDVKINLKSLIVNR